jgi:xanthine dehydrogenase accessory factor
MSVYLEPLEAPKRVIVFGGGHVGAAVARVIKTLGCVVTVVDEREEWANRERFPDVDEIVNRPFAEQLTVSPPGSKDHVLIITRGHEQDQLVLEGVIEKKPVYLGMIGSRKKAAKAIEKLRSKKVSEELLRQVRSPVGLDIGAVTPEEIAISIAAELVLLWRRGGTPGITTPRAMSQKPPGLKPLGKASESDSEPDDVVFDDSEDEEGEN